MTYVALVQSYKYLCHNPAEHLSIVNKSNIIKFLENIFHESDNNNPLTLDMSVAHTCRSKSSLQAIALFIPLVLFFLSIGDVFAQSVEIRVGQDSYQIEIASTSEQRQKGLMYREHLSPRQGMLLVYPRTGDHRIWMKNMRIALQVYWIDEDFVVLDVQRLQPCSDSPCPVYSASADTRYVLELGDYQHKLVPGDRIEALSRL